MDEKILVRKTDLARILGVSSRTVYNYTKVGLLEANKRFSGYFYDPEESRKRFKKIEKLKDQGKTLKEIKTILDEKG